MRRDIERKLASGPPTSTGCRRSTDPAWPTSASSSRDAQLRGSFPARDHRPGDGEVLPDGQEESWFSLPYQGGHPGDPLSNAGFDHLTRNLRLWPNPCAHGQGAGTLRRHDHHRASMSFPPRWRACWLPIPRCSPTICWWSSGSTTWTPSSVGGDERSPVFRRGAPGGGSPPPHHHDLESLLGLSVTVKAGGTQIHRAKARKSPAGAG